MNKNSLMYKFIKTAVGTRKGHKTWENDMVERYVSDNFYAFSRGDVLIATTNTDNTISYPVSYLPSEWKEGEPYCNIFYPVDCV